MSPPLPPAAVDLLACPVCGGALAVADAGLGCAAGHAFDRARHGHVTLLPPGHRPPSGDDAAMVADRVTFLSAGHYAGLTEALGDAVLGDPLLGETVPADAPPRSVLDLGGGTGHHLAGVLDRSPASVGVVLDSSRYAARRAARTHPRAMAVVADTWARLPVRDGVLDAVLVVFAPRNGTEIARVLAPGGRLVVATPEPEHLTELVGPLGLLRVDPDKEARLAAGLGPHLTSDGTARHEARLRLRHHDVLALVGMGPHARHRTRDELAAAVAGLPDPVEVTVAVRIGRYRRGG